jgi:competence protein ComEA
MEKNSLPWSRQQRTGVLALLFILIVLFVTWRLLPALWPPGDHREEEQLVQAWLEFKEAHVVPEQEYPAGDRSYAASAKDGEAPSDTLFFFDPNTVSEANLTKLGLPPHTVRTILKYRSKGGWFYKAEDLQKLYTLAPSDYRLIHNR